MTKPFSPSRVIARAIDLNEKQRDALLSVRDHVPAGHQSTLAMLARSGYIEYSNRFHRYILTDHGAQICGALPEPD